MGAQIKRMLKNYIRVVFQHAKENSFA